MAVDQMLVVDGRAVARTEVATTRRARARGLLGTTPGTALVLPGTRSVHTVAMSYALDVALCASDGKVLAVAVLPPNRLARPRRGVRTVVEAPAGSFERWGLQVGARIEIRPGR